MAVAEFKLDDDSTIQIIVTSRCAICGEETDSYEEVRNHVDNNPAHYFIAIIR